MLPSRDSSWAQSSWDISIWNYFDASVLRHFWRFCRVFILRHFCFEDASIWISWRRFCLEDASIWIFMEMLLFWIILRCFCLKLFWDASILRHFWRFCRVFILRHFCLEDASIWISWRYFCLEDASIWIFMEMLLSWIIFMEMPSCIDSFQWGFIS